MARMFDGCKAAFRGITERLPTRDAAPKSVRSTAPRILAIVPQGSNRLLLQAISREAGWSLKWSESIPSAGWVHSPPAIVVYEREPSISNWQQVVEAVSKISPRPYLILLSPNTDLNLWNELQRVGGSDVLRTPLDRERLLKALKRAWTLWRCQQQVRNQLSTGRN